MSELLTDAEKEIIDLAADIMNKYVKISTGNAAHQGDMLEMCFMVHGIQNAVLAQAASRAYPGKYRPVGGWKPEWVLSGESLNNLSGESLEAHIARLISEQLPTPNTNDPTIDSTPIFEQLSLELHDKELEGDEDA